MSETRQSNKNPLSALPRPEGPPPDGAWTVTPEGAAPVAVWRAAVPTPPFRSGRNSHGYGRKIPLGHAVYFNGRWRRVYAACYGNAGTAYLAVKGESFGPVVHGFQSSPGLLP